MEIIINTAISLSIYLSQNDNNKIENYWEGLYMEDNRTLSDIINQLEGIDKSNSDIMEYITSIDLLLTSNNNGTVKDAEVSKTFTELKNKLEEAIDASKQFKSSLEDNIR